jgi:acyl dehydratase
MRFKTAGKLVTREDIKRFASEFDPQPYHLDEMAAVKDEATGKCTDQMDSFQSAW